MLHVSLLYNEAADPDHAHMEILAEVQKGIELRRSSTSFQQLTCHAASV
jgi:hypothetical protein